MTLPRTVWALPTAVSVAVLAHVAVFGTTHAPGAGHALDLFGALGVTLGLAAGSAFLRGAGGSREPVATKGGTVYGLLLLVAAAAGTFGAIELSEGHLALGPWLQGAAACLPLALAVARVIRAVDRAAVRAGTAFALLVPPGPRASSSIDRRPAATLRLAHAAATGHHGGRAPPAFL